MKRMTRAISLLLALLMLGSTMAWAVDEVEEFNQALLDETIRINHEMGLTHISTEKVEVHLKSNVTVRSEYEKLFPELDAAEIKAIAPSAYENGTLERQILLLTFADKTEDDIWEIVEILKVNSNVYYAAPMFVGTGSGLADTTIPGDVNGDSRLDNRDLILTARYVVDLIEFDDIQFRAADMNEDGAVDNTDLIAVARAVVGSKSHDISTLNEERKAELHHEFVIGRLRDNYNEYQYRDCAEHVEIEGYLGQFSGCDVVNIRYTGATAAVIPWVEVAGHYFEYGGPVSGLYAFKDGEHLSLEKAYEAGWVTAEDVAEIWSMGGRMHSVNMFEEVDGVFVTKEVVFRSF